MKLKTFLILAIIQVLITPVFCEGTIKSATEYDYPPFSVTDNNKADGFSVELLKAVAEEMNLDISFKVDKWSTIKSELENGELDVLPLVGYTEERDMYFDFSVPYIVMHGNIFVRDDNKEILSEDDLYDKEIIVMNGDNAMEYAIRKGYDKNLIVVDTYTEGFKLLSSGKYDALLAQSIVGMQLIDDLQINNIRAVTEYDEDEVSQIKVKLSDFEQKFCFAVKEGDKYLLEKLNEGLSIVTTNGRYQEIYLKWFPFMIDFKEMNKEYITSLTIIFAILLIIGLIVFTIITRSEIKRKTKELIKINEKLHTLNDKAESASQIKSKFLANMSHEIRTPLSAMSGLTCLLEETDLSNEQREYVNDIKISNQLLIDLVGDILDISKIEAGKIIIKNEKVNLIQLVEYIYSLHKRNNKSDNLNMSLTIKSEVPEYIFTDTLRVKQIVNNLLSNAIKFTPQGAIELCVSCEHRTEEEAIVSIAVKDTGIGISDENIEKIMNPFVQVDDLSNRKYGGTGLGLSITRELLNLLNGNLIIKSKLDVGSEFIAEFKCKIFSNDDENINYNLYDATNTNNSDNRNTIRKSELIPNILVVEDNELSTKIIKRFLIKKGIHCDTAVNGIDAIKKHKKNKYDLIFMDCQMPILDGFEATRQIRKLEGKYGSTKIVALTANVMTSEIEKCYESGMDYYLSKPIDFDVLLHVIRSIKEVNED